MGGLRGKQKTLWTPRKGSNPQGVNKDGSQRIVIHQAYVDVCAMSRGRWKKRDQEDWNLKDDRGTHGEYIRRRWHQSFLSMQKWHDLFTCWEIHSESNVERRLERYKSRVKVRLLHGMKRWRLREWRRARISESAGAIHCTRTWFYVCIKEWVNSEITTKLPVWCLDGRKVLLFSRIGNEKEKQVWGRWEAIMALILNMLSVRYHRLCKWRIFSTEKRNYRYKTEEVKYKPYSLWIGMSVWTYGVFSLK